MKFYPKPEGMPRPLYISLTRRDYTAGNSDYSVTTLLKPPRILALERRFDDQIIIDCRRNAKALLGTFWHDGLERKARQYPDEAEVVEEIMYEDVEIEHDFGEGTKTYVIRVKGQTDYENREALREDGDLFTIEQDTLWDYKTCSQWMAHPKYRDKPEWTQQLNIYRWMMERRGHKITRLRIAPMFTDHKEKDKLSPFAIGEPIELEMWTNEQTVAFVKQRIILHESVKRLATKDLPRCTAKDRWMNVFWKVRRRGSTEKAENFGEDAEAAANRAAELNEKLTPAEVTAAVARYGKLPYEIVYTPDIPRRCASWCNAAVFCSQFKEEFPAEYERLLAERLAQDPTPLRFDV